MDKIFLETERLVLEYITQNDFEELASILKDRDVMYAWEYEFSDEEVQIWIDKFLDYYEKYGLGYFLVRSKKTKEVIGQVGLMPTTLNDKMEYEIGYILKKEYWHRGYARECVEALLEYSFNVLHLDRVLFEIRPENEASLKVAEFFRAVKIDSIYKEVKNKKMLHSIYAVYK